MRYKVQNIFMYGYYMTSPLIREIDTKAFLIPVSKPSSGQNIVNPPLVSP